MQQTCKTTYVLDAALGQREAEVEETYVFDAAFRQRKAEVEEGADEDIGEGHKRERNAKVTTLNTRRQTCSKLWKKRSQI